MLAPQNERDLVHHRGFDRKRHDSRVVVPGHVADFLQHEARDAFRCFGTRRKANQIAPELRDEIREVPDAALRIERMVVGDEERAEPENLREVIHLEQAVLAAAHGDDAVIGASVFVRLLAVLDENFFEFLLLLLPIDLVPAFRYPAAATHSLLIKDDRGAGIGRIATSFAVFHGYGEYLGGKGVSQGIRSAPDGAVRFALPISKRHKTRHAERSEPRTCGANEVEASRLYITVDMNAMCFDSAPR